MAIPGDIFYNTGTLQQQRAGQHLAQNYASIPGGLWSTFPSSTPYCQNCDCGGCKIHRESLRLQQEEDRQRIRIQEQALYHMRAQTLFDAEPKMKPGSVVQLAEKPGIVTEEWWKKHRWKFYVFWALGAAAVVHLFMTCVTRDV